MNFKICKRRHVTLIEMMIVMFLIALITGVIAYNYRGSLEEGKAFKSKAGIEKIETILNLEGAKDPGLYQNISQWKEYLRRSPLVQDVDALSKDGWGIEYAVEVDDRGRIVVSSERYNDYRRKHQAAYGTPD